MKTIKYQFLLLIIIVSTNFVQAQKIAENINLPNFSKVSANLYRGAQPTEEGIKQLAKLGVKTIINLRGEDKNSLSEIRWAQNAHIKFVSVNLSNWFEPNDSDIVQIIEKIDAEGNQPVFIHCKRGADRTGTVIAVYRITHDKYTAKQAIAEAKKFDFGWWQFPMKHYINEYYEHFKKHS